MLAREALSTLELPYTLRSAGFGSPKRAELLGRFGATTLPVLVDPNNSHRVVSGGRAVAQYLFAEYQIGDTNNASFFDYSTRGAQPGHFTLGATAPDARAAADNKVS